MDLEGLLLVGRFARVEPVRYGKTHDKAGQEVGGLARFVVTRSLAGGTSGELNAGFETFDRFTGLPTPVAQQIDAMGLVAGERVAVVVSPSTTSGSRYANLDAHAVIRLDDPDTGEVGSDLRAVG